MIEPPPSGPPSRRRGGVVGATILIVIGLLFLIQNLAAPNLGWNVLWPIVLIVFGVAVGVQPLVSGEPLHYTRSFWAVALIALGAILLIGNLGLVNGWQIDRLGDLWPLILVLVGLEILITRSFPRQLAAALGAAVALLAVFFAALYIGLGPGVGVGGSTTSTSSAPILELPSATLDLNAGAATLAISSDVGAGELYHAKFHLNPGEAAATNLDRSSGILRIDLQNRVFFFGPNQGRWVDLSLSNRVPWNISINGGASRQTIDLSGLALSQITINGGAQQITLTLPRPSGSVPIDINAGAVSVTIHRPAGSEASLQVSGAVNDFTADGQHQSSLAGDLSWQSPGYGSAPDRYTIHVSGGANHIVLDAK